MRLQRCDESRTVNEIQMQKAREVNENIQDGQGWTRMKTLGYRTVESGSFGSNSIKASFYE